MSSYIVSARKYRPTTFRSVVGQKSLTTTLKNAIKSGKLAHAYLFCGPRGVGKTTCARIFAKTINCQNLSEEFEACDKCESCMAFNNQRSFNIHELDAASKNSVEDIRSLNEQVRIPPQIGKYSLYIIDEAHMLSGAAFNAFLKTLEEPPAHAIFILATTEKHKIIPTIRSRCQIYDFNRITIHDIIDHLKYIAESENVNIDNKSLNIIAQKSDGAMRDALSIFDQLVSFSGNNITYLSTIENLNVLDYEYYFKLIDAAQNGDVATSLLIFDEILRKGFDASHFVSGLSSHIRDVIVSKDEVTIQLLEAGNEIGEKYKKQAEICSLNFLFGALNLCNECDINYRASKNKKLLVEITLIKLCQLSELKKKVDIVENNIPALQKIEINTPKPKTDISQNSTNNEKTEQNKREQQKETKYNPTTNDTTKTETSSDSRATQNQPSPSQSEKSVTQKRLFPSTISIKKKENIENINKKDLDENGQSSEQNREECNSNFTNEELKSSWIEYTEAYTQDNTSIRAFLTNHFPVKGEDNYIVVKVDNIFQEKELLGLDIIKYLRKELKNSNIRLKVELDKQGVATKRSSPQEIYNRMTEQNAVLKEFVERLKLEAD